MIQMNEILFLEELFKPVGNNVSLCISLYTAVLQAWLFRETVVGKTVRGNTEIVYGLKVANSCLIEFHGVLPRRKKNLWIYVQMLSPSIVLKQREVPLSNSNWHYP